MKGQARGIFEVSAEYVKFARSAPVTAPHNLPRPPTATQMTIQIESSKTIDLESFVDASTLEALEIPSNYRCCVPPPL